MCRYLYIDLTVLLFKTNIVLQLTYQQIYNNKAITMEDIARQEETGTQ